VWVKRYTVEAHASTPPKGADIFSWKKHEKKHRKAAKKETGRQKEETGGQEEVVNFVGVCCA